MRLDQVLFPSGVRIAIVGSLVWLILLAGVLLSGFQLSIFALLFLLAPWVVVPLALSLLPATQISRLSRWTLLPKQTQPKSG